MILRPKFFERNAVKVAKDLIGCFLCTPKGKFMIVETEAYEGLKDLASHASRGKTQRNQTMFGGPGVWYIYFTYGMHHMLNIVCGSHGHPAAVLIRGITASPISLLGPAKLTKYLNVDKTFNGKKSEIKTGLWLESARLNIYTKFKIIKTPRIGVSYAGPIWSKKKYRFVVKEFETKKF